MLDSIGHDLTKIDFWNIDRCFRLVVFILANRPDHPVGTSRRVPIPLGNRPWYSTCTKNSPSTLPAWDHRATIQGSIGRVMAVEPSR